MAVAPLTVTLPIPVTAAVQACGLPSKPAPGQETVTSGAALLMVKDCGTSAAALTLVLPACEAVTVHEPAPVMWTVEPATVQLPLAAKVTVRLEDAVALTAKSASPKFFAPSAPKVIVWFALAIENDCGTSGAAL